jgi:hypothetical protein
MTLIKEEKYLRWPTASGRQYSFANNLRNTLWLYMRLPAQTVNSCGNIEKSSWHSQRFTKDVRTLIEAGYQHIGQQVVVLLINSTVLSLALSTAE